MNDAEDRVAWLSTSGAAGAVVLARAMDPGCTTVHIPWGCEPFGTLPGWRVMEYQRPTLHLHGRWKCVKIVYPLDAFSGEVQELAAWASDRYSIDGWERIPVVASAWFPSRTAAAVRQALEIGDSA